MSVGINVDPDKPSGLRGLLGGLGMIAGFGLAPLTGGTSLAAMSMAGGLGGAIGTLGGGVADSQIDKNKDLQGGGLQIGGGTAIQRRQDQQSNNPLQHITDALNVVHTLPAAMQDQVKQPLMDAMRAGHMGPNLGVNTNLGY